MMNLEQEIIEIKKRNSRVEADKAWEVSWIRRLFIAFATYVIAAAWLWILNDSEAFLKALVPAVGYLLSTITIPWVKRIWVKHFYGD